MTYNLTRAGSEEDTISKFKLLTIPEAARILNIGRTKAYELARMREIPVVRIGNSLRIPQKDLFEWIKNNTQKQVRE